MGDDTTFVDLRPALFGVAYRMLGSVVEAEDVVQEAYLRWASVDASAIASPRAYLTTVVTRLSIDYLRSARVRRETYIGQWLPEPVAVEDPDSREFMVGSGSSGDELADSLSLAVLVLLEVFGYDYAAIARTLERSEPACRQLVSRARRRVGNRRQRFDADREQGLELTRRFVVACGTGDIDGLLSLLAQDVVVWTDGGGQAKAAPRPVVGPWRAARWLVHVAKSYTDATIKEATLNGQPGLVFAADGAVTAAVVLDVLGGKIAGIRVVANPDKLARLRTGE